MRLFSCVLMLIVSTSLSMAQTPLIDKLISEGVSLFDNGKYDDAIQKYERVLDLNAKNLMARYELAYTWYTKGDFAKAIEQSRVVVQANGDYWVESALIYGASLENQGKSNRAVKVFEMAIAKHPESAQLHYNAALSYFSLKGYNTAEKHVTLSLDQDVANPAGHLLLANIMLAQGEKFKSMMALYYYLLIEQDTERSPKAFELLQNIWEHQLRTAKLVGTSASRGDLSGFRMAEISTGRLLVNDTTSNDLNRFQIRTTAFLNAIHSAKWDDMVFWKSRYVDFYSAIDQQGFDNAFAAFVCQCKYKAEVMTWISDNYPVFGGFTKWMEKQ